MRGPSAVRDIHTNMYVNADVEMLMHVSCLIKFAIADRIVPRTEQGRKYKYLYDSYVSSTITALFDIKRNVSREIDFE